MFVSTYKWKQILWRWLVENKFNAWFSIQWADQTIVTHYQRKAHKQEACTELKANAHVKIHHRLQSRDSQGSLWGEYSQSLKSTRVEATHTFDLSSLFFFFSSVCLWPLLDIKLWTLWMISINNYGCSYVPAGLKHDSKFYLPCWTITNILCRFIYLMNLKITKNIQGLTHFSLFEVTPYWHILISQKLCKNTMSFLSSSVL